MSNILIQPLVRLFGWSTSDISQYGDQPTIGTVGPNDDAHAHLLIEQGETNTSWDPSERGSESVVAGRAVPAGPIVGSTASQGYGGTGNLHPATIVVPAAQGASTAASNPCGIVILPTSVVQSFSIGVVHASSAAPAVASSGASTIAGADHGDAAMPVILPVLDHADSSSHSAAPIAAVAPAIADAALPLAAYVDETATSLINNVAAPIDAVAPVLSDAAAVIAPVVDDVAHLLDTTALTAPLTGLGEAVVPAVAPVVDTVTNVADLVTPLVAAAAPSIAAITAPLVQSDIAGAVTDHLAGTDPAAGVQTLVGLVGSVDAFHVGPVGTTPAPAAAIIDTLADDHTAPALLGIVGDHHDLHLGIADGHHSLDLGL